MWGTGTGRGRTSGSRGREPHRLGDVLFLCRRLLDPEEALVDGLILGAREFTDTTTEAVAEKGETWARCGEIGEHGRVVGREGNMGALWGERRRASVRGRVGRVSREGESE